MSFLFGHPIRGKASSEIKTVEETARVGEKPDGESKPPKIDLLIFTEPGETFHAKEAQSLLKEGANGDLVSKHLVVEDAELASTIRTLRKTGEIHEGTQIVFLMHGSMDNDDTRGGIGKTHVMSRAVDTLEVMRAIREPLDEGGKACSATIYIASCFAGGKAMRRKVQELHDSQGAGACFLLANGKEVLDDSQAAPLRAMCEQFIEAKRAGGDPPTPHHIFWRMASNRGDCLTMIRPNRMVIAHGPRTEDEFGMEGLEGAIDDAMVIIPEKGAPFDPESWKLGNEKQNANIRKPKIVADSASIEELKQAWEEVEPDQKWARSQWERVLNRKALRASKQDVEEALAARPDLMKQISKEGWNDSHRRIFWLVNYALQDEDHQRSGEKAQYLYSLISGKKDRFDGLNDNDRLEIIKEAVGVPFYNALLQAGFLVKSEREGVSEESRIRHLCLALAEVGELNYMTDVLESHPRWQAQAAADGWNESHQLVTEMLAAASKDVDVSRGKAKAAYLLDRLKPVDFIRDKLQPYALRTADSLSVEDMESLLKALPPPEDDLEAAKNKFDYQPTDAFVFLENMLRAIDSDWNPVRAQDKLQCIVRFLESQFGLWVKRAQAGELKYTLMNIPGFRVEFNEKHWNDACLLTLQMMRYAAMDPSVSDRDKKLEILFDLLSEKKAAFHASPDRAVLMRVAAEDKGVFDYLDERGFFSPRAEG
jgi:hypothetical protein